MGVGGPEGRADEGGMNGHCCGQQEPWLTRQHCVCTGNLGSFDRVDAHGAMEVGGGKALSSQVGSVIMLGSRGGKEPERVREELPSWGNDEDRALQEWKKHSGEPPEPQVVNEKGRALIGPHEDQAGQHESRQSTVSLSGEDCAAEGSCQPRLSCLAVLLRAEELMLLSPEAAKQEEAWPSCGQVGGGVRCSKWLLFQLGADCRGPFRIFPQNLKELPGRCLSYSTVNYRANGILDVREWLASVKAWEKTKTLRFLDFAFSCLPCIPVSQLLESARDGMGIRAGRLWPDLTCSRFCFRDVAWSSQHREAWASEHLLRQRARTWH